MKTLTGTITADDAAFLIQRLAEALARGHKYLDFTIDGSGNIRVAGHVAATIREEGTA
jgi:hypothetical protein